ncbi:MAG: HTTM domain-containing protein [Deltaproteobacteria bacterium]|nr:HTTM domain-containing protein [Deltaproteobacteria bacterium]
MRRLTSPRQLSTRAAGSGGYSGRADRHHPRARGVQRERIAAAVHPGAARARRGVGRADRRRRRVRLLDRAHAAQGRAGGAPRRPAGDARRPRRDDGAAVRRRHGDGERHAVLDGAVLRRRPAVGVRDDVPGRDVAGRARLLRAEPRRRRRHRVRGRLQRAAPAHDPPRHAGGGAAVAELRGGPRRRRRRGADEHRREPRVGRARRHDHDDPAAVVPDPDRAPRRHDLPREQLAGAERPGHRRRAGAGRGPARRGRQQRRRRGRDARVRARVRRGRDRARPVRRAARTRPVAALPRDRRQPVLVHRRGRGPVLGELRRIAPRRRVPPRPLRVRVIRSLQAGATRQVDIASLAAFRIIFGAVMLGGILRLFTTGFIEPMYLEPRWFFSYPGFEWVRPWPGDGMYVHYGVLAALALMIALGAWYRIVVPLFTLGFLYTQLIDVTNYLNHHYLVVLLGGLLAFLPANAMWSVDARRRPELRRATVPAWMVWLLRFQVGVVYCFAGLAKLKLDWLGYGQPLNLWLAARSEMPLVGRFFEQPWFALVMSWAGFLFDSTIVVWLSWPRTRLFAYGAVLVFHSITGILLNIGMFPIIMSSSALIFFSPSWPRRLPWLGARVGAAPADTARLPREAPPRVARVAIAVYVALQVALPLRHYVYPGPVLWNEDGMRFAWHVVVREKQGAVRFEAEFANGKRLEIPSRNYLTARQEREMCSQPDLILQLARHIGRDLRDRGYPAFRLYAFTAVSLNGRAPAPMIDPTVDLLEVSDIGPRTWVLPEPDGPPPHVGR